MKKRFLAVFLALALGLGLVAPALAAPAESAPTDWYFLFAIFKNVDADYADETGKTAHITCTMTQEEIDLARENAQQFELFMNQFGLIRAHMEVMEIDEPITELQPSKWGPYLDAMQAAPLLKEEVNLDQYDHVMSVISLNVDIWNIDEIYVGMTNSMFENATGHSCVNLRYAQEWFNPVFPESVYIHEFLHFMERMSLKWGVPFHLHDITDKFYAPSNDEWRTGYVDIIQNQSKGDAETGTGVHPAAWQNPPHVLRTMREFTIPDGTTTIGEAAFQYLSNLEQVTIPSSVTCIENLAFYSCSSLKSVTIPSSVTSIKEWAFAECSSLESVKIPNGITSIERAMFYNCNNLHSVTIPSSVTSIGEWAFAECSSLESVKIPNGVTSIDKVMFYNCNNLHSVTIPASITNIGEWAFAGCSNLSDIYYGGSEAQWKVFVNIDDYNEPLEDADIHYDSTGPYAPAFTDVPSWFEKEVAWAAATGITNGYGGNTTFAPDVECPHIQILTFLWRAKDKPISSAKCPVPVASYYQEAANWAYEKGLIDDSFNPNAKCTRADAVSYIWQALGSQEPSEIASFSDMDTNSKAVSWAVEKGVTKGYGGSDTFAPNRVCTRGEIAAFLYRAFNN